MNCISNCCGWEFTKKYSHYHNGGLFYAGMFQLMVNNYHCTIDYICLSKRRIDISKEKNLIKGEMYFKMLSPGCSFYPIHHLSLCSLVRICLGKQLDNLDIQAAIGFFQRLKKDLCLRPFCLFTHPRSKQY